jgi:hypothetical protein
MVGGNGSNSLLSSENGNGHGQQADGEDTLANAGLYDASASTDASRPAISSVEHNITNSPTSNGIRPDLNCDFEVGYVRHDPSESHYGNGGPSRFSPGLRRRRNRYRSDDRENERDIWNTNDLDAGERRRRRYHEAFGSDSDPLESTEFEDDDYDDDYQSESDAQQESVDDRAEFGENDDDDDEDDEATDRLMASHIPNLDYDDDDDDTSVGLDFDTVQAVLDEETAADINETGEITTRMDATRRLLADADDSGDESDHDEDELFPLLDQPALLSKYDAASHESSSLPYQNGCIVTSSSFSASSTPIQTPTASPGLFPMSTHGTTTPRARSVSPSRRHLHLANIASSSPSSSNPYVPSPSTPSFTPSSHHSPASPRRLRRTNWRNYRVRLRMREMRESASGTLAAVGAVLLLGFLWFWRQRGWALLPRLWQLASRRWGGEL